MIGWARPRTLDERERARRGLSVAEHLGRDDSLWPGQLATLTALLLYLALPPRLTIGPNWTLPAAELVLFATLIAATPRAGHPRPRPRMLVIGILSIALLANLVALGLLTRHLIEGGNASGADLIGGGVVIWLTNLLLFAVWYWELYRGGPPVAGVEQPPVAPDLLFPQMSDERWAAPGWKPRFGDYLYVSLTNQTAFSPTDTMPLTMRAKLLMAVQGVASLVTVGIIVARAVNILG